jgi:alpha-tubulin suppressor-like RCC1 family protein
LNAPTNDFPFSPFSFNYLVESLAAGKDHTCVQIRTGGLRCFGNNSLYQLNDGTTNQSPANMAPQFYRPLSMIAAGAFHTCGVLSDFSGRVGCMGDNQQGQFGDNTSSGSSASKTFSYANGINSAQFGILAAGKYHTCTGLQDGTIRCWGLGDEGQLGQGAGNSSLVPVASGALDGAVREISAGEAHTCVRTSSAIQCFGRGTDGQLGQGAQSSSNSPVTVQINSL